MAGRVWNMLIATAIFLMAWAGFLLSVMATILSLYMPFREETPVFRLKPRHQSSTSSHTALHRTLPVVHHLHSLQSNPTTPTTSAGSLSTTSSQSNAEFNTLLRSRSWDSPYRLPTSPEEPNSPQSEPVSFSSETNPSPHVISSKEQNRRVLFQDLTSSPHPNSFHTHSSEHSPDQKPPAFQPEPSFVVFRPATNSSDTTLVSPHVISNKDQNREDFDPPAACLRRNSFHIPAFRRRPDRRHRTSRSTSPPPRSEPDTPSAPSIPICLKKYSKQLRKAPSVPTMVGCSNSTSKRTTPVPRTQPYEAPYFFPKPGTPAAADYGRQYRVPRRAATTLPPR